MKKMTLLEIIKKMTDIAVSEQLENGSFINGHNGPYNDMETNVRNTAHWLVTLSILIRKYSENKYKIPARKALNFLLSSSARPKSAAFFMRKNPLKDSSNGLIGQAWVIEGLNEASKSLNDTDAAKVARDLYNQHKFDKKNKCWLKLDVDGTCQDYDLTFNHQLWFASIALELFSSYEQQYKQALSFFENASANIDCYRDGIIFHGSKINTWISIKNFGFINSIRIFKTYLKWQKLREKSIGYHTFNLFAFCRIYNLIPGNKFWSTSKWQKIFNTVKVEKFWNNIKHNKYAWAYNNPGIESLSINFIESNKQQNKRFISKIIENSYNDLTYSLMDKVSSDSNTSNARIYELLILPINLQMIKIRS